MLYSPRSMDTPVDTCLMTGSSPCRAHFEHRNPNARHVSCTPAVTELRGSMDWLPAALICIFDHGMA